MVAFGRNVIVASGFVKTMTFGLGAYERGQEYRGTAEVGQHGWKRMEPAATPPPPRRAPHHPAKYANAK